jgi:mono/diheme cytochrome c family protein
MPAPPIRLIAGATLVLLGAGPVWAGVDPAAVFQKKCTSCHTFGGGDLVGPDLKGVTGRRTRAWLRAWIQSSERTIKSGDRVAVGLFDKYKQERMPDQALTVEEIDALLNYLAASGPDADRRAGTRSAASATPDDVERGRKLFAGTTRLASGGAACVSCHGVRDAAARAGGSFGGDLSRAYSRFQDTALSTFLQHPCFPRVPGIDTDRQLTDDEVFAVKAFLRHVDSSLTAAQSAKGGPR